MKVFLLAACAVIVCSCGTNKAIYQSPDFSEKTMHHKTVAILPVKMVQSGHVAKNIKEEDIQAANEQWGYQFQESLQSLILRQTQKRKDGQLVSFQAIQKTNALLKAQRLNIEELYNKQPEELVKLLGVDAVIMTSVHHNKNFSDGVAYGIAAVKVLTSVSNSGIYTPGVNSSDINMNCALYDATDSKLLWKTYRDGGTNLPSNVEGLIEYYSNWIAKKLPYKS